MRIELITTKSQFVTLPIKLYLLYYLLLIFIKIFAIGIEPIFELL